MGDFLNTVSQMGQWLTGINMVKQMRAREDERMKERKLQQQVLKHQLERMKIDDQLHARAAAMEQAGLMSQQPGPVRTEADDLGMGPAPTPAPAETVPQPVPSTAPQSVKDILQRRNMQMTVPGLEASQVQMPAKIEQTTEPYYSEPLVVPGVKEYGIADLPMKVPYKEQAQKESIAALLTKMGIDARGAAMKTAAEAAGKAPYETHIVPEGGTLVSGTGQVLGRGSAKPITQAPGSRTIFNAGTPEERVIEGPAKEMTPDQVKRDVISRNLFGAPFSELDPKSQQKVLDGVTEIGQVDMKLNPEAMDAAAYNYATTGQLPFMGMGKSSGVVRQQIMNRAGEIFQGLDIPARKAAYGSYKTSLDQLQKSRSAVGAFEQTASKNLDLFLGTTQKIADSGIPILNIPLRMASGKLAGSKYQAAFEAARRIAITEVAKVTSNPNLSGQLSDTARKEVESFVPESATVGQMVAVVNILKKDMGNRIGGLDAQIKDLNDKIGRMGRGGVGPSESTTAPANPYR